MSLDWLQLARMAGAGGAAGVASGLLGVTPGGILVPCLVLGAGSLQHRAQALSLIAQLVPTSLAGLAPYRRAGHGADARAVLWISLAFVPGACAGALAAGALADRTLRWAFVAYLGLLAITALLRGRSDGADPARRAMRAEGGRIIPAAALLAIGVVAGLSSGLLGIGGGLAIIAALTLACSMPQHAAQAVSLGVAALPLGLPAVWVYAMRGEGVQWSEAVAVVVGLAVGTYAGAAGAARLPATAMRRCFLALVLAMAGLMAWAALAR